MKTEFRAKYLQHLLSKKKKDEGFTLIELLVVIIIVGVLSAIALPSFLNQIGKARGSEAKAALGTINRSQQSFRLVNQTMSANLGDLDARISPKFYTYTIPAAGVNTADALAGTEANTNDLKVYSSRVEQNGDQFDQIICESDSTFGPNAPAVAPVDATIDATPANRQGGCAADYTAVQ